MCVRAAAVTRTRSSAIIRGQSGTVAQLVEQGPFKALVLGSSPSRPTNKNNDLRVMLLAETVRTEICTETFRSWCYIRPADEIRHVGGGPLGGLLAVDRFELIERFGLRRREAAYRTSRPSRVSRRACRVAAGNLSRGRSLM